MKIYRENKHIIISGIALFAGILFYAFYNEVIIIRIPSKKMAYNISQIDRQKKRYSIYFWKDGSFSKDEKELISSSHKTEMLTYIITNWLSTGLDEKTQKKVQLESVMLDANQVDAYISFDRNPFLKESSTFEKWMLIESLLKTIRESGVNIQAVMFLIHQKPLIDHHLDFSRPWPITGFI